MAAQEGNGYRKEGVGKTALERFAAKCRFDPVTGCVLWTGGTSSGRGNSTRYGVFWDGKKRVWSHRWAAVHIHGFDLGTDEAGHCCKPSPNSLCVQHLEPQSKAVNTAERNVRYWNMKRLENAVQDPTTRQHWLFRSLGILEPEPIPEVDKLLKILDDFPFHTAPEWFVPFMPKVSNDDVPF